MSRFPVRPRPVPRPRPTAGPTPGPTPAPTPSPIGNTFTLTTNQDIATATTFNGVINFGGGTQASAGTTMNSVDELTGTAGRSDNTLNVQLINANGVPITGGGAAVAEVDTITLPSISYTNSVAQVNQVVFTAGTNAGLVTFSYNGTVGTAVAAAGAANVADTASAVASSVNSVAGATIAFAGQRILTSANNLTAQTATSLTFTTAPTGLVVGQSVTGSGFASGTQISAINGKVVTLSKATTSPISANNATIDFGGGAGGVSIIAANAGTPFTFGITAITESTAASSLIAANVTGTIGSVVNFNYGGNQGSYVIGTSASLTAQALATALDAVATNASAQPNQTGVRLTADVPGIPLSSLTFSGASNLLPTVVTTTPNSTATSGISFGTNTGLNVLNLTNISGSSATVSASATPGATTYRSKLSSNDLTFSDLPQGATAVLTGNGALANGALTATYADTATTGNVVIEGGTTRGNVTINGTGLTTQTITSQGASNKVGAIAGAGSATTTNIVANTSLVATGAVSNVGPTLNISGAGNVNISQSALGSGVKTVNASANSGGVWVRLNSNADISVTGSSGSDVIIAGAALTTGFVNAGSGVRDTLVIGTNTSFIDTAAEAAKYTNFDVLALNGTYDFSLINGITAVELTGATNSITKLTATQAANIAALQNIGNTTIALADSTGSSDLVAITFGDGGNGTGNGNATTAGALTINGFERLNVTANPGSTATAGNNRTATIGSLSADVLTSINLAGTAVTLTDAGTTKATTINASALTGDGASTPVGLTIGGGTLIKGTSVTGSNVQDKITTSTSAITGAAGDFVTFDLGAGDDGVVTNVDYINNTSASAGSAKFNGGTGKDSLALLGVSNNLSIADKNFQFITNFEEFGADITGTISVVSGAFYNTNQSNGAGWDLTTSSNAASANNLVVNLSQATSNQTVNVVANSFVATTKPQISTGSGNDSVTVSVTSLTDGGGAYSTGAGNDTLAVRFGAATLSTAAQVFTGGLGADTISALGNTTAAADVLIQYAIAAGDSTVNAFDTVTNYARSAGGSTKGNVLDFAGTPTIAANISSAAVPGFTASQLTYSVSNGKLSFAGTSASSLNDSQIANFVQQTFTSGTESVAYLSTTGIGSFVFNNNSAGDSLVYLSNVNAFDGVGVDVNTDKFINLG